MHRYSKSLLVATLCASGVVCLFGCARRSAPEQQPAAVQIVVTTPIKKSIVEWDEYVGRFDAVDFVEVRARVSGYLQSIHFEEGQIVNEGDLLFIIDPRPFAAELNRAKAQVVEAKAKLAQSTAKLAEAHALKSKAEAGLNFEQTRLARSKSVGGLSRGRIRQSVLSTKHPAGAEPLRSSFPENDRFRNGRSPALQHVPVVETNTFHPVFLR